MSVHYGPSVAQDSGISRFWNFKMAWLSSGVEDSPVVNNPRIE